MGASQERAAFFNATLLVVTRHPGGRQADRKFTLSSRFAFYFLFIKTLSAGAIMRWVMVCF
jgi:hypothetical protein